MTKQQAVAEMKYQLNKYILQVLLDEKLITVDEAIQTKVILLEKYDPFTRCLEEVDVWQTGHLLEFHIVDGTIIPYQMLKTAPRQSRLTQAAKTKILQTYSTGQTPAAIAKELNIPSSTIRSLISRSKERVKRPTFNCQNCGKSFAAHDYQKRKYCSQNCYRVSRFYGSSKCETDVSS